MRLLLVFLSAVPCLGDPSWNATHRVWGIRLCAGLASLPSGSTGEAAFLLTGAFIALLVVTVLLVVRAVARARHLPALIPERFPLYGVPSVLLRVVCYVQAAGIISDLHSTEAACSHPASDSVAYYLLGVSPTYGSIPEYAQTFSGETDNITREDFFDGVASALSGLLVLSYGVSILWGVLVYAFGRVDRPRVAETVEEVVDDDQFASSQKCVIGGVKETGEIEMLLATGRVRAGSDIQSSAGEGAGGGSGVGGSLGVVHQHPDLFIPSPTSQDAHNTHLHDALSKSEAAPSPPSLLFTTTVLSSTALFLVVVETTVGFLTKYSVFVVLEANDEAEGEDTAGGLYLGVFGGIVVCVWLAGLGWVVKAGGGGTVKSMVRGFGLRGVYFLAHSCVLSGVMGWATSRSGGGGGGPDEAFSVAVSTATTAVGVAAAVILLPVVSLHMLCQKGPKTESIYTETHLLDLCLLILDVLIVGFFCSAATTEDVNTAETSLHSALHCAAAQLACCMLWVLLSLMPIKGVADAKESPYSATPQFGPVGAVAMSSAVISEGASENVEPLLGKGWQGAGSGSPRKASTVVARLKASFPNSAILDEEGANELGDMVQWANLRMQLTDATALSERLQAELAAKDELLKRQELRLHTASTNERKRTEEAAFYKSMSKRSPHANGAPAISFVPTERDFDV